jgi:hypothetical protein
LDTAFADRAVGAPKMGTIKMRGGKLLVLSVADAAMSRLVTLRAYKADWRGETDRED